MEDNEKGDSAQGRAVIYTRFSPRRDASECESCAWQCAECEQFAHRNGYRVDQIFNDPDVSGADALRPALWDAIHSLFKGDTLIVWKWDRLARDLILALQIERAVESRGASVVATTGDVPGNDPHAQFTRHILMAVSELERKMISHRTSVAMKALQKQGRRMTAKCKVPFGWKVNPDDDRYLVENQDEQAVRKYMIELMDSGEGYASIARHLNERGINNRSGSEWSRANVYQVLKHI